MGIKKEKIITYLFVCVLIGAVVTLASLYFIKHGFTGFAVYGEYENETACVDAGYTWENLTNETCTTIPDCVECVEGCLTGEVCEEGCVESCVECEVGCQENCTDIPDCVECVGGCVESCAEVKICADNCILAEDLCEEDCQDTCQNCSEIIIGGQCVGDVCDSAHLNLCDETNCNSNGGGYWYNETCNVNECASNDNCASGYECNESGVCVEVAVCGNGNIETGEECDDGNTENNDGCSSNCQIETEEEEVISEENITIESEEVVELDIFKLTLGAIQNLVITKNESKEVNWSIKNIGTTSLTNCQFRSMGEFSSWINHTEAKNLAVGEEHKFVFDVDVPEETEPGNYSLLVSVGCQETGESINFVVEVITKKLDFNLIKVRKTTDEIKIIYSLEELSGLEQNISMGVSLFDLNNEKISEAKDNKILPANSTERFRILMPINASLETNASEERLNLLVNLDSEIYSTSVQESIILGRTVTGFAIFGRGGTAGNIITLILIVLFLGAAFFIIKKVRKLRKGK